MKLANYISVDVETAGPAPSLYPMLSIGACLVADPDCTFYVELRPDRELVDHDALQVSGLDLEQLKLQGTDPRLAMTGFAQWVTDSSLGSGPPIFVAYNAPFDWMFIQDYFQRYDIKNPFGHSALDMKALAMGLLDIDWSETGMQRVASRLDSSLTLTHHALQDARDQAQLFQRMLNLLGQQV